MQIISNSNIFNKDLDEQLNFIRETQISMAVCPDLSGVNEIDTLLLCDRESHSLTFQICS
jgi:hypothetical protein